jgi:hypothetical protein
MDKPLNDLEMLRAMVETHGLETINRKDYHLAKTIRQRLDATRPTPKQVKPSGVNPEETISILRRLPDPKGSLLSQYHAKRIYGR